MREHAVTFKGYNQNRLWGKLFFSGETGSSGVLLCHGFKTDHSEFGDFPERLAKKGVNVFVFDYSGHGRSEGKINTFSAQSHRGDTLAAIDTFKRYNVKRIFILGHSLGSHAAMTSLIGDADVAAGILVTPMRKGGENLPLFR